MIKFKTIIQRCLYRPRFLQPRFHYRTLNSSTTKQTIAYINFISSNPLFSLLYSCRNLSSLKELHSLLIVDGQSNDLNLQTKLVSLYGSFGDIQSARLVFDQMPNPDIFSCKVMIRWYFINDLHSETIGFYKCMMKCVNEHDNVVFSIVVKACTELRDINEGRKVHCRIVKAGSPDSFVLTSIVDMYAKCGEINCSRRVFDSIIDRNIVCWTSMIVAYVQNDCPEEALMLFNRMRNGLIEANQHTLGSIISACTKLRALHQAKWVHGYAIKNGFCLNSHFVTSLVNMYVKCHAILDARSTLNELSTVDLVSWTAMIVGYSQNGYPNEAITLFNDKKWTNILPNSITILSIISACAQSNNPQFGQSIHSLGIKLGLEDLNMINSLIDMYAKCRMIGNACYLFDSLSNKDLISWNSIINGYMQNGYIYNVIILFRRMRLDGFHPDEVTLVTLLSGFASYGDLQIGFAMHAYMLKKGLISCNNVYIGTALLHFYAKCGELRAAREVFDNMGEKNIISWNALINAYGKQGDCNGSITVFNDMVKEKLDPTDATFTAILSACSHTGRLDGWKLFEEYEFVPKMNHYGCLVDLLARSGRLDEAFDLIEKMPVRPDVSLFGAFLNGCSMHSRFDLGEAVVRRMLNEHPFDASYYVLVSNLYALDGRWRQVSQVRKMMKTRDMCKSLGCSR